VGVGLVEKTPALVQNVFPVYRLVGKRCIQDKRIELQIIEKKQNREEF
jgi:hypothetical protein